MPKDSYSVLDELDREYAPAWKPKAGEKIAGVVTDLSERDGGFGRYPIVTVRADEDGEERSVHAFHEVLSSELGRIAPKVGDVLGIKYLGKDPAKGYHVYRVRRAGDDSGVDWTRYTSDEPSDVGASELPADTAGFDGQPEDKKGDDDIPF